MEPFLTPRTPFLTTERFYSSLLAIVYVVVSFIIEDGETAFNVGFALIFPLAIIWFSEEMGGYIGPTKGGYINRESSPFLLKIIGWIFLLVPGFIFLFSWFL